MPNTLTLEQLNLAKILLQEGKISEFLKPDAEKCLRLRRLGSGCSRRGYHGIRKGRIYFFEAIGESYAKEGESIGVKLSSPHSAERP
jgi:hypothetical protein